MKMQTDCLMSETMTVATEYSDFQIIVIFFTSFKSFDSEKKSIERELAFSEKIMSFSASASILKKSALFVKTFLFFSLNCYEFKS